MTPSAGNPTPGVPRAPGSATPLVLSLFVTDSTPSSVRARAQLTGWLHRAGSDAVRLEVVDVLEHPDRAEVEHILATPTLIRHHPLPRRKIIGDLSDWEAVVLSLDLQDGVA
jgi:circadian clock protein KaiB